MALDELAPRARLSRGEVEQLVGAVILPSLRPVGGLGPGSKARRPSRAYLERFPPVGVIGFGRRLSDGATIPGLAEAIAELRADARAPFFVCADLERGAGYHVPGATWLPPVRAIAEADRADGDAAIADSYLARAAELTGREARAAGIELVLAPVLDVNSNPANPIIGPRALGTTPQEVALRGRAFLHGLAAAGVGASLKHFPGHGDTHVDSHLSLPRIDRARASLEALELAPFRDVLGAPEAAALGAALTVMVGHLDVPALTGAPGCPTSLAPSTMDWLAEAGFEGAVLTDGLEMLAVADAPELGVRALEAGCHGLLGPRDEGALAEELVAATLAGRLDPGRLREAARRMRALAVALEATGAPSTSFNRGATDARDERPFADWARNLCLRALVAQPWAATFAGCARGPLPPVFEGPAELVLGLLDALTEGGAPELARELHAAPRLRVAGPRHPLPARLDHPVIWFGPSETVPDCLTDHPHLWAWAPDPVVARALVRLVGAAPSS